MNSSAGQADNDLRISLSEGDPPYTINAELIRAGSDFVCIVTGGTHAHTGAVSLAEPAVSVHPVTGVKQIRGNVPIVRTLLGEGHKDALPAELYAKALCQQHGTNVVCTAGIHIDEATPEEIEIMMKNVTHMLERLLEVNI